MTNPPFAPSGPDPLVALAGWLAERGVVRLELIEPGREARWLLARSTDLPAELRRAAPGSVLRPADRSFEVVLTASGPSVRAPG